MTEPRIDVPTEPTAVRVPGRSTRARAGSSAARRSTWRQSLVDVERGVAHGLRIDGALFALMFGVATTILAGLVVGLDLAHWIAVVLALTLVLVSGMFNQILKAVWSDLGHHFPQSSRTAVRIGTAAVCVALLGGLITITLAFVDHFQRLF